MNKTMEEYYKESLAKLREKEEGYGSLDLFRAGYEAGKLKDALPPPPFKPHTVFAYTETNYKNMPGFISINIKENDVVNVGVRATGGTVQSDLNITPEVLEQMAYDILASFGNFDTKPQQPVATFTGLLDDPFADRMVNTIYIYQDRIKELEEYIEKNIHTDANVVRIKELEAEVVGLTKEVVEARGTSVSKGRALTERNSELLLLKDKLLCAGREISEANGLKTANSVLDNLLTASNNICKEQSQKIRDLEGVIEMHEHNFHSRLLNVSTKMLKPKDFIQIEELLMFKDSKYLTTTVYNNLEDRWLRLPDILKVSDKILTILRKHIND